MKFYIVTFDREPETSYGKFHAAFVSNEAIIKWSHHIKSSYIIGTNMSADELSDHYAATAKSFGLPTTHLVLRVNLSDRQGYLPKSAWAWFKKNERV